MSWHSADPDRMRRVLAIWDGHLADPCLPRTLAARLRWQNELEGKLSHSGVMACRSILLPSWKRPAANA